MKVVESALVVLLLSFLTSVTSPPLHKQKAGQGEGSSHTSKTSSVCFFRWQTQAVIMMVCHQAHVQDMLRSAVSIDEVIASRSRLAACHCIPPGVIRMVDITVGTDTSTTKVYLFKTCVEKLQRRRLVIWMVQNDPSWRKSERHYVAGVWSRVSRLLQDRCFRHLAVDGRVLGGLDNLFNAGTETLLKEMRFATNTKRKVKPLGREEDVHTERSRVVRSTNKGGKERSSRKLRPVRADVKVREKIVDDATESRGPTDFVKEVGYTQKIHGKETDDKDDKMKVLVNLNEKNGQTEPYSILEAILACIGLITIVFIIWYLCMECCRLGIGSGNNYTSWKPGNFSESAQRSSTEQNRTSYDSTAQERATERSQGEELPSLSTVKSQEQTFPRVLYPTVASISKVVYPTVPPRQTLPVSRVEYPSLPDTAAVNVHHAQPRNLDLPVYYNNLINDGSRPTADIGTSTADNNRPPPPAPEVTTRTEARHGEAERKDLIADDFSDYEEAQAHRPSLPRARASGARRSKGNRRSRSSYSTSPDYTPLPKPRAAHNGRTSKSSDTQEFATTFTPYELQVEDKEQRVREFPGVDYRVIDAMVSDVDAEGERNIRDSICEVVSSHMGTCGASSPRASAARADKQREEEEWYRGRRLSPGGTPIWRRRRRQSRRRWSTRK